MSAEQQQQKRIEEGPPIWVESILSPEDYKASAKKYKAMFSNGPIASTYDPSHHKGGKWRARMGRGYTPEEIAQINKNLDNLHNLLKTKKFQKQPDYGPHNEAKP